jgi:hypothetical protein
MSRMPVKLLNREKQSCQVFICSRKGQRPLCADGHARAAHEPCHDGPANVNFKHNFRFNPSSIPNAIRISWAQEAATHASCAPLGTPSHMHTQACAKPHRNSIMMSAKFGRSAGSCAQQRRISAR